MLRFTLSRAGAAARRHLSIPLRERAAAGCAASAFSYALELEAAAPKPPAKNKQSAVLAEIRAQRRIRKKVKKRKTAAAGAPEDVEAWLARAADGGHAPACAALGDRAAARGDAAAAEAWYERGGGDPGARYGLGALWLASADVGVRRRGAAAVGFAAAAGHGAAGTWLAHALRVRDDALDADAWVRGPPARAVEAAEDDDGESAFWGEAVGPEAAAAAAPSSSDGGFESYWRGALAAPAATALRLLEDAAAAGHGPAAHYLALAYRAGDDGLGVSADADACGRFLEEAAASGHGDAQFYLGELRFHGDDGAPGVAALFPRDRAAAFEHFAEAAAGGHAEAAVSAGALAFNGWGVARDASRAADLYMAAAEAGHPDAWRNLATMHATGEGVRECAATVEKIRVALPRIDAAWAASHPDS